jgi:riboflavin synthase
MIDPCSQEKFAVGATKPNKHLDVQLIRIIRMFTGIIETLGKVVQVEKEKTNVHFTIESAISHELKVDQSVAHNGVCLTVVAVHEGKHTVTAIQETLNRTDLNSWLVGSLVNLERCMQLGGRLDGHIVQGHVDTTALCTLAEDRNGSWYYRFEFEPKPSRILVNKGSITVNGVSLTVVEPTKSSFGVAIIPYTFAHTTFQNLKEGDQVNLEFDIIGKYITQYAQWYGSDTV